MARTNSCSRIARALLLFIVMLPLGLANAATLTLEFDTSFGDPLDPGTAPPDGAGPWLTALFDDGNSAGSVTLTLTVGAIGIADIDQIYFNLDTVMDPVDLTLLRTGGTGPTAPDTAISIDSDNSLDPNLQADGDGVYDILFDFANSPQASRFSAGETLTYSITGAGSAAGLVASSFNFLSEPSLDPLSTKGPFLAAAKVLDTGSDSVFCQDPGGEVGTPGNGECSDWIAAPVVPVPAAVWLFGSALGLLGWVRLRKSA